jgi:hypothetical protein
VVHQNLHLVLLGESIGVLCAGRGRPNPGYVISGLQSVAGTAALALC